MTGHPTLHRYQVEAVDWLLGGAARKLLAFSPGLGKSAAVLRAAQRVGGREACAMYNETPEANGAASMLVVCPKSVAPSWHDECAKWRPDLLVTDDVLELTRGGAPVCVVTWPQALKVSGYSVEVRRPLVCVIDEPHDHRHLRSRWVQGIAGWTRWATRVWATDGTPIFNRVDDLYMMLCLVGCAPPRGQFDQWVRTGTVRHELTERGLVLRRELADVEGDIRLPPLRRTLVRAPLPRGLVMSDAWVRAKNTGALRVESGKWKWSVVLDMLTRGRLRAEVPTVVWYVHKAAARDCAERLRTAGVRAVCVTGESSIKRRGDAWRDFAAGAVDWLVLTSCAQAGVQLQRAKVTVLCEVHYEPKARDQATARMWRQGQTQATEEITIVWNHETDEHALGMCQRKGVEITRVGF